MRREKQRGIGAIGVDLRERLSVGLDVVGSPQHDGNRLGPCAARLLPLRLQQPACQSKSL